MKSDSADCVEILPEQMFAGDKKEVVVYDFTKAVEEVIEQCKVHGTGKVQRFDNRGKVTLWLEADLVEHPDGIHNVVELFICYSDTGKVAYGTYIAETKTVKNKEMHSKSKE